MFNLMIFILLSLSLDYATFRENDTLSNVELYIAIPYTSFNYYEYEEQQRADYSIDITIKNQEGDTVAHDEFGRISFLTSLEDAQKRILTIIDLFSVSLPAGRYETSILTKQQDNEECVSVNIDVTIYQEGVLSISDLELVSEISEAQTVTRFTKGNNNLIPNPERIYGEKRNILYVYSELYGLSQSEEYSLVYRLTDTMGDIITEYPEKKAIAEYPHLREIGGINTTGLTTGSYIITLQLSQDKDTTYSSKSFFVLAKEKVVSILDGKEEEYYSFIKYIASSDELSRYKEADDKKSFLEIFWARKGEDILLRYIEIVKKADELYGKEKDMGRIYIIYGPPDEVLRYTEIPAYPDNEIWSYYSGGGKTFVFADILKIGKFELVYSSYEREYTNPLYHRYVNPEALNLID